MYSHTAQSTSGELNQNNKGVKKKRGKKAKACDCEWNSQIRNNIQLLRIAKILHFFFFTDSIMLFGRPPPLPPNTSKKICNCIVLLSSQHPPPTQPIFVPTTPSGVLFGSPPPPPITKIFSCWGCGVFFFLPCWQIVCVMLFSSPFPHPTPSANLFWRNRKCLPPPSLPTTTFPASCPALP